MEVIKLSWRLRKNVNFKEIYNSLPFRRNTKKVEKMTPRSKIFTGLCQDCRLIIKMQKNKADTLSVPLCFPIWAHSLLSHSHRRVVYTVKLVYKDHRRDQHNLVLIYRWSLKAGSITWKVYPWGCIHCGLYKQVVFIYTWSLE